MSRHPPADERRFVSAAILYLCHKTTGNFSVSFNGESLEFGRGGQSWPRASPCVRISLNCGTGRQPGGTESSNLILVFSSVLVPSPCTKVLCSRVPQQVLPTGSRLGTSVSCRTHCCRSPAKPQLASRHRDEMQGDSTPKRVLGRFAALAPVQRKRRRVLPRLLRSPERSPRAT